MIHRAARQFALERLGETFWSGFAEANGLTEAAYVTAQSYPDELTFSVMASLAEAAGMTQAELLEAFGVYWIDYARRGAYANMMALGGKTLPGFIASLNRMHAGLAMAMPAARMPDFFLLADTPEAGAVFEIRYRAAAAA